VRERKRKREMENKKERIFENTHVVVNVKSKKILSIKVTDEHVHDSKALPELVENIIKSGSMATVAVGKLFADGAYDGNEVLDIWEIMESCLVSK
jgi:hypothetical protein